MALCQGRLDRLHTIAGAKQKLIDGDAGDSVYLVGIIVKAVFQMPNFAFKPDTAFIVAIKQAILLQAHGIAIITARLARICKTLARPIRE